MREPRADIKVCAAKALPWLQSRPGVYVTPGWVVDRGVECSEHAMSMALKLLVKEQKIDYRAPYGIPTYAWLPNLKEVLAERERESKRKKTDAIS